jgi:hypothetical protein
MRYPDNDDHYRRVIDFVQHSGESVTHPVLVVARKLFGPRWPWIARQSLNLRYQFLAKLLRNAFKLFG